MQINSSHVVLFSCTVYVIKMALDNDKITLILDPHSKIYNRPTFDPSYHGSGGVFMGHHIIKVMLMSLYTTRLRETIVLKWQSILRSTFRFFVLHDIHSKREVSINLYNLIFDGVLSLYRACVDEVIRVLSKLAIILLRKAG